MKSLLTTIYLFVSISSFSQINNSEIIQFDVLCGAGAKTSKEIEDFKILNSLKNFDVIRKKLVEGSYMEQVLSTILLNYYQTNKIVDLTKTELRAITQIEKSRRKYSLCFTCTFQKEGTLKQLFKQGLEGLIKEYIFDPK